MRRVWLIPICVGLLSCGGSKETTVQQVFNVELYSFGGISGRASGVTITGDGLALHWSGRSANLRTVHDSVMVDPQSLEKIKSLVSSDEIYSISYERSGDITTVLKIQWDDKLLQLSYADDRVPDSFPPAAKELIEEIQNLHTR